MSLNGDLASREGHSPRAHFLKICSSVDGHSGCVRVWAIVNSAAVNLGSADTFSSSMSVGIVSLRTSGPLF